MKNFLYLLILPAMFCFGSSLEQNEEEVLFLNRIADFWEEGEYAIAKNQIQEFLITYPQSSFASILHAAIGEIFLREKQYQSAVEAYAKIEDPEIASTVFPHRIECLYHMQWYPILADECEAYIQKETESSPHRAEITYYLAMALYHQCVMVGDKQTAKPSALRAEPYFVQLLEESPPLEVLAAYAQILWILDQTPKSSEMYARLAEKHPETQELQDEAALMHVELIQFYYREQNWTACREQGKLFLAKFPNHPQEIAARKFIIDASIELANLGEKETLLKDLEEQIPFFPNDLSLQVLLAKTEFLQQHYEQAMEHLQDLLSSNLLTGILENDAKLLLGLCFRDALQDSATFCKLGEEVLQNESSFLTSEGLHTALYNAYLEQGNLLSAETHLFALFEKGDVDLENLEWLSQRYFERRLDPECKTKAIAILEKLPPSEKSNLQLSALYFQNGDKEKAISLLETVTNPSPETSLLLAEHYLACNEEEKALSRLQGIPKTGASLRTFAGASAALLSAQLQIRKWTDEILPNDPLVEKTLTELKDIVLHKNSAHEPIYLEAALDYLELQNRCHHCESKHLLLLKKTKKDFESMDDLLSKDYHLAREKNSSQNKIYQSYLKFIEASIYKAQIALEKDETEQKELQAKAKDLLLRVIDEQASPALIARAKRCLDQ
jgi:thioredoxin-like negative regulator of GroEL